MKMEVEIISKENIKPSSPTPHDQKIHNLSLLDQIVPPFFAPMVFYYPNPDNKPDSLDSISQITRILKQSLSSTLTRFYPLAGRIKDHLSVDCNDQGILFVVAKLHENLSGFLENPDPKACRAHIPCQLTWAEPGPGAQVAMIQVNYFDCGGIVIGLLFYHKVADGVTMATFMKDWAAEARGLITGPAPSFDFQSLFPANAAMQRESHLYSVVRQYFKTGKTIMRRYVFDAPEISALRGDLSEQGVSMKQNACPTRVEIVSAVMWKYYMVACSELNKSGSSTSLVTHVMNMRRKAEPPFPDNSFGNFVWLVPASSTNNLADMKSLFGKVRSAIRRVDPDFIKRMEGGDGFSGYSKNLEDSWSEFPEKADYLSISSWCNFGLYGVDFGWGKPVWISKCDAGSDMEWPFLNGLWLMDTREGDGVEAWLTLDEEHFAAFDKIREVRDLARVDPSPLDVAGIGRF